MVPKGGIGPPTLRLSGGRAREQFQ
jgi:hypothetical protein